MVSYVEMIQWNFEMTLARLPVAARLARHSHPHPMCPKGYGHMVYKQECSVTLILCQAMLV